MVLVTMTVSDSPMVDGFASPMPNVFAGPIEEARVKLPPTA